MKEKAQFRFSSFPPFFVVLRQSYFVKRHRVCLSYVAVESKQKVLNQSSQVMASFVGRKITLSLWKFLILSTQRLFTSKRRKGVRRRVRFCICSASEFRCMTGVKMAQRARRDVRGRSPGEGVS